MESTFPTDGHFKAEITIFPLGEATRKAPPFNGVRWAFSYEEDADQLNPLVSDIWPEFLDKDGISIAEDVPLSGTYMAKMHIVFPNMVEVHLKKLKVGARFYCMEGARKVASGVVTTLTASK